MGQSLRACHETDEHISTRRRLAGPKWKFCYWLTVVAESGVPGSMVLDWCRDSSGVNVSKRSLKGSEFTEDPSTYKLEELKFELKFNRVGGLTCRGRLTDQLLATVRFLRRIGIPILSDLGRASSHGAVIPECKATVVAGAGTALCEWLRRPRIHHPWPASVHWALARWQFGRRGIDTSSRQGTAVKQCIPACRVPSCMAEAVKHTLTILAEPNAERMEQKCRGDPWIDYRVRRFAVSRARALVDNDARRCQDPAVRGCCGDGLLYGRPRCTPTGKSTPPSRTVPSVQVRAWSPELRESFPRLVA